MSEQNWIIWNRACDAMQAEILKTFEDQWEESAVITRTELREILEDVHHPKQPNDLPKCS